MLFHQSDDLTVYNADLLDALPQLAPQSIDSVVTSPPYAMQRESTYGGVPEVDYPEWTVEWMRALKPALTERGSVMINISPHVKGGMLSDYVLRMRLALRADGWFEHDEIVWVKPNVMPSGPPSRPQRAWESVLWYSLTSKPFGDPLRNGSRNSTLDDKRQGSTVAHSRAERLGWKHSGTGGQTAPKPIARCRNYCNISPSRTARGWDHPAPFPEKLADWLMKINTPDGGTVLDPFAGSGTTAVAAHANGFKSVAIERDPAYAQMIVDRYKSVTLA